MAGERGFERGVVAAGHPATAAAAAEVLERGGNAYDAAVAAGFAGAIAEPGLTSLAGGGFLLARPSGGREVLFDFFVDTPGRGLPGAVHAGEFTPVTVRFGGADQVFNVGAGAIAVPGCLPGYLHVQRRLGRLGLADVVAPARRLAAEGVVLGGEQVAVVRLLEAIFTLRAQGRARYAPGGRLVGPTDRVAHPDLAAFLDRIAAGEVRGFDEPGLAARIAQEVGEAGGLLTAEDLAAYTVVERDPLRVDYRGARLVTNPPPSFGGALVGHALAALDAAGPPEPGGSLAGLERLAGVLEDVTAGHTDGRLRSSRGTTHVSVADAEGNLAAMTTSNGSCSGVFLAGTGVMANNIMGEADLHPDGFHAAPPGQRVGSMMAPSLLLRPGAPDVALGSGGSERIRSALTQVVVNLVDEALGLAEAIDAPRVHWDGATLQAEPEIGAEVCAALAAHRPVNRWARRDLYFGGVHAVAADGEAAGDARRGGSVAIA
ncbi:MAG: gamma-glutamyltransferase [Actinomycetota bacterium]